MTKSFGDFFPPSVSSLYAPTPQRELSVAPETVEARLRGMVALANPTMSGAELHKEQDQAIAAYRNGGPLARVLRRLLIGEIAKQRRRPPRADSATKIAACERALALSKTEAAIEWNRVSHLRPTGKRGKPTNDRFALAVCWCEPECQNKSAAAKRYGQLYRRRNSSTGKTTHV